MVGNTEVKILVDLTEVKIPEAEAKGIKIHTKANIHNYRGNAYQGNRSQQNNPCPQPLDRPP